MDILREQAKFECIQELIMNLTVIGRSLIIYINILHPELHTSLGSHRHFCTIFSPL